MSRRNNAHQPNSGDEAEQVHQRIEQEDDAPFFSQESGQDLIEDASRDYNAIPELDQYEDEEADRQHYELNPQARRRAEKELNKRDQLERQMDVDDYMVDQYDIERREMRRQYSEIGSDDEEQEEARYLDYEECKGQLTEWIKEGSTRKFIKRKFIKFIRQCKPQGQHPIYYYKIREMIRQNKQSLQINYHHFKEALPTLTIWLGIEPQILLPQLNSILYTHLCKQSHNFQSIVTDVYVKFYDLPIHDSIPHLRTAHIGKLIKVKGVATARGQVLSQLKKVTYKCYKCGELKGPYLITGERPQLGSCRSCQSQGPFTTERNKSLYRNHQKVVLQEPPSDVEPGRIPRSKEVLLFGDNVDQIKPGEEVEVIGIYMLKYELNLNLKHGFPVMGTFIQANSIKKINDVNVFSSIHEEEFVKFSRLPELDTIIYNSIAPSIYGHEDIKQAIAFSLFGGTQKYDAKKMHKIRGDINLLLLGDPGIAKSQFLKSIQKVFPRCVFATGKGASAVGLTASVKPDPMTKEWRLEAGAMVLADKGICLIDEFDKMNDHDRTSIHEAMEQQTISISKAGIVAQLKARCGVIAAANPIKGIYDQTLNFAENVNLSDPILSRFDIVKVMKDRIDTDVDYQLSTFVINSHISNHPYLNQYECEEERLQSRSRQNRYVDPQFLKQYIKYAREKCCKTTINQKCAQIIKNFYIKLRESSDSHGGIKVTARQLQSMIRICEAHAKMHLRPQTQKEDAEIAMKAMLRSYIQTQKHGAANKIKQKFWHDLN